MNKKIIFMIIIIISIVLIVGDVYLKMEYDEKKESEAKYYDEQEKK
ncbi:conserved domain protein [Staphylococcus epidermidis VCU028]|nr:conserved domain protein [Staphylococcus epidermidis VCU028]